MSDENERLGKLLAALGDVMRLAHERGLVDLLGGNASFRWGDGFYITPSQVPKHILTPEDMVYVPFDLGPQLSLSGKKASMEWRMHQAIYLTDENIKAVLHTHNPKTLALYSAGLSIDPSKYVEGELLGDCVATVPSLPAGSSELAKAVGRAIKRCRAVVLLNHGVVVASVTPYKALDMAEALEDISMIEIFKNILSYTKHA
jgi:L-fuculose-phosphate aldolase